MKPLQILLLVLILLLAGLVLVFALRNRQPPILPADAGHATFVSAESCLSCHGPSGARPQSPNHPVGRECMRCHGSARRGQVSF